MFLHGCPSDAESTLLLGDSGGSSFVSGSHGRLEAVAAGIGVGSISTDNWTQVNASPRVEIRGIVEARDLVLEPGYD